MHSSFEKSEANNRPNANSSRKQARVFTCQQPNRAPADVSTKSQKTTSSDALTFNNSSVATDSAFATCRMCVDDFKTTDVMSILACGVSTELNTVDTSHDKPTQQDFKKSINPDFCPLQYVDIEMQGVVNPVSALVDSGSEICLASMTLFEPPDVF